MTTKGENGGVYLTAKKGKLTVGVNAAGGYQKLNGISYDSTQKNLGNGDYQNTEMVQNQKSPFVFADLNASYEVSPRDLLSGSFGMTGFYQSAAGNSKITMGGVAPYSYVNDQEMKYRTSGINGSLDYQHTSAEVAGRALTLSYRYSGSPLRTEFTSRFSDMPFPLPDRMSEGDDNSQENTFQLDYTTPVGAGQSLSSGLKYIARHNSADDKLYFAEGNSWIHNTEGSMLYDHFNDIGAIYSEYTGTFGKFSLIAGLRYEYTWQKVRYGKGFGQDFKTGFGDIVPSASLQYNIAATRNIGLTYNRRIQRPGITYLNPYVNRSSPTVVSYGNSDLTSARSDIISVVFNSFNPKWIVSLYGNIVVEDNTGMTAFVNWTAGPKTRIYTNSSVGYSMFSSDELGQKNHGWNWNVMAGLQQTLPADMLLSANLMAGGKTWTLQGWNKGFTMGVIGLSKGFLANKLRITGQFISNFEKGGMTIESFARGGNFETRSKVTVPIRQVGLNLTYTFGKQGFQVKKTRKSITNDDVINNTNGQAPGTGAAGSSATGGAGAGQGGM